MNNRLITIKIGGEAGFGIKVAGATLGTVLVRMGYQVFDYTEYPSLIRGGHNTFEITIGKNVHHHVRPVNLLVALNQQAYDQHLSELSQDAGVIFDEEKVKTGNDKFYHFGVPFSRIAREAHGSDLMKNTVALAAALGILGCRLEGLLEILKSTFAKKPQPVIDANLKAANDGYAYAKEHYKENFHYKLEDFGRTDQLYLTGSEAVGLGAMAADCRFYVAYPMTPATPLLTFLSEQGSKAGMIVRQSEDEISALNTAIGANWAGMRTMTGTSGGGFSLMVEALGLASMTETPVVIYEAQRAGPATGLPTWSSQGDLRFLMHAAQDDFPRMIIAPGDPEECFYHTAAAFNYADKFQMPVFILSDKNLAEGGKTVPVFDFNRVVIERGQILDAEALNALKGQFLRYKVTDTGVSPRVIPGTPGGLHIANSDEHDEYGYSVDNAKDRAAQMEKRMRKLETLLKEMPEPILYGPPTADLTIVSWGSTKGAILQALEELQGVSINFLHFIYVWPFPTPRAVDLLRHSKKLMVVENNFTGQFAGLIAQKTGRRPEIKCLKYDGRPFWPHEIKEKISSLMSSGT